MGVYLDPTDTTKEAWLAEYGYEVSLSQWRNWRLRPRGYVPLCYFESPHPCVLVAFSPREVERSLPRPTDHRTRRYYYAPLSEVKKVPGMARTFDAIRQDVAEGLAETDLEL